MACFLASYSFKVAYFLLLISLTLYCCLDNWGSLRRSVSESFYFHCVNINNNNNYHYFKKEEFLLRERERKKPCSWFMASGVTCCVSRQLYSCSILLIKLSACFLWAAHKQASATYPDSTRPGNMKVSFVREDDLKWETAIS